MSNPSRHFTRSTTNRKVFTQQFGITVHEWSSASERFSLKTIFPFTVKDFFIFPFENPTISTSSHRPVRLVLRNSSFAGSRRITCLVIYSKLVEIQWFLPFLVVLTFSERTTRAVDEESASSRPFTSIFSHFSRFLVREKTSILRQPPTMWSAKIQLVKRFLKDKVNHNFEQIFKNNWKKLALKQFINFDTTLKYNKIVNLYFNTKFLKISKKIYLKNLKLTIIFGSANFWILC